MPDGPVWVSLNACFQSLTPFREIKGIYFRRQKLPHWCLTVNDWHLLWVHWLHPLKGGPAKWNHSLSCTLVYLQGPCSSVSCGRRVGDVGMFGGVGTPTLDDAFPQPSGTSMLHGRILIQRMCGGGFCACVLTQDNKWALVYLILSCFSWEQHPQLYLRPPFLKI